jgi:hypothetical protein
MSGRGKQPPSRPAADQLAVLAGRLSDRDRQLAIGTWGVSAPTIATRSAPAASRSARQAARRSPRSPLPCASRPNPGASRPSRSLAAAGVKHSHGSAPTERTTARVSASMAAAASAAPTSPRAGTRRVLASPATGSLAMTASASRRRRRSADGVTGRRSGVGSRSPAAGPLPVVP